MCVERKCVTESECKVVVPFVLLTSSGVLRKICALSVLQFLHLYKETLDWLISKVLSTLHSCKSKSKSYKWCRCTHIVVREIETQETVRVSLEFSQLEAWHTTPIIFVPLPISPVLISNMLHCLSTKVQGQLLLPDSKFLTIYIPRCMIYSGSIFLQEFWKMTWDVQLFYIYMNLLVIK